MGTYVISDIHGCFDEFQNMLKIIQFSAEDRLYLAGDYIDRGSQSVEMLKWLEKCPTNVIPIKGNHDAEFAAYIGLMKQIDKSEELATDPDSDEDAVNLYDSVLYMLKGKATDGLSFFDYYGTIADMLANKRVTFGELCRWGEMLASYPYYYRFPIGDRTCVVVHAGFCEAASTLRGNYGSLEEFYLYAREDAVRLGGIRNGIIVAGHTPTIAKDTAFYRDGEVYRYFSKEMECVFYDIDCGCAYYQVNPSGTMACIRLEDEEVFYL